MRYSGMIAVAILAVAILIQGCGRRDVIELKGSDTMVNLGQAWAEAFHGTNPEAAITVTGGGSGTGIAALLNGNAHIAQSSRDISEEELERAQQNGMKVVEFDVAIDGVAVIVNPNNPMSRLTEDQLSDIYTGRIKNWSEVGGEDREIVVLSRDSNSGTHVFFLEYVVRKNDKNAQYAKTVLLIPSSQAIGDEVSVNASAIGYIGIGYVDEARHKPLWIAYDADSPYIEPTEENILNRTYPIARPLHFYTPGEPEGMVKDFIDFVLSDEGQQIVVRQEFVPIRKI